MDIAGNRSEVRHSWLLEFGERDYPPSPCKMSIISHHQPQNFTQMLQTKTLRSNHRLGVKKTTDACCNLAPSIEFSEFGEINGPFCIFFIRLSPLLGQRKGEIKFITQKQVYFIDGKSILNFSKNRYVTLNTAHCYQQFFTTDRSK